MKKLIILLFILVILSSCGGAEKNTTGKAEDQSLNLSDNQNYDNNIVDAPEMAEEISTQYGVYPWNFDFQTQQTNVFANDNTIYFFSLIEGTIKPWKSLICYNYINNEVVTISDQYYYNLNTMDGNLYGQVGIFDIGSAKPFGQLSQETGDLEEIYFDNEKAIAITMIGENEVIYIEELINYGSNLIIENLKTGDKMVIVSTTIEDFESIPAWYYLTDEYVYWTYSGHNFLMRTNRNGLEEPEEFTGLQHVFHAINLLIINDTLYYSDTSNVIAKQVWGSVEKETFLESDSSILRFAPLNNYIYWINEENELYKKHLDSGDSIKLYDNVVGINTFDDIALITMKGDSENEELYYILDKNDIIDEIEIK